jgi:hypothetical protein
MVNRKQFPFSLLRLDHHEQGHHLEHGPGVRREHPPRVEDVQRGRVVRNDARISHHRLRGRRNRKH